MTEATQQAIDARNAAFWDELCGTALAQSIGITDHSPESLRRFDAAYMDLYPYLPRQLRSPARPGEPLLEIGLGYGTVSQRLAEAGFDYHGLDIAPGPVEIVRERLRMLGSRRRRASASSRAPRSTSPIPTARSGTSSASAACTTPAICRGRCARSIACCGRAGRRWSCSTTATRWRQLLLRARAVQGERAARPPTTPTPPARPRRRRSTSRRARCARSSSRRFADVRDRAPQLRPHAARLLPRAHLWLSRERALPTVARVLGLDLYIHARK